MKYQGVIKKSRTLDLAALQVVIDAGFLAFMAYSPEQLGLSVPVYFGIRVLLSAILAYLRFRTTGPVGEKE